MGFWYVLRILNIQIFFQILWALWWKYMKQFMNSKWMKWSVRMFDITHVRLLFLYFAGPPPSREKYDFMILLLDPYKKSPITVKSMQNYKQIKYNNFKFLKSGCVWVLAHKWRKDSIYTRDLIGVMSFNDCNLSDKVRIHRAQCSHWFWALLAIV